MWYIWANKFDLIWFDTHSGWPQGFEVCARENVQETERSLLMHRFIQMKSNRSLLKDWVSLYHTSAVPHVDLRQLSTLKPVIYRKRCKIETLLLYGSLERGDVSFLWTGPPLLTFSGLHRELKFCAYDVTHTALVSLSITVTTEQWFTWVTWLVSVWVPVQSGE